MQGRDHSTTTPRGMTDIRALRDAGVLFAAGADNVQDPFFTVGRNDSLETAALLVMATHQFPDDAYQLVSNDALEGIGMPRLNHRSWVIRRPRGHRRGFATRSNRRCADVSWVNRRGVLVASADHQTTVHRTQRAIP